MRPLFLFGSISEAFGLNLFRPRWLALGSFFFHICDMLYLSVWLLCPHCSGGVDIVHNLSLSGYTYGG